MAKRHHSSKKHHESGHLLNEHSSSTQGYYEGPEHRRKMEMEDGGMIMEDHRAIANLPQEVMIKPYPKPGYGMPEGLDDTIRGIDRQVDYDESQRRKTFNPKKV